MREQPLFSIVTASFNKEKEFPFFLESIFRQTLREKLEIILVDDCSSDRTVAFANYVQKEIHECYPWIDLIVIRNEENIGNCLSRNKGIVAARGEYLIIIDADCMLSRNFLEEYHRAIQQTDVVVANFGIELRGRPALKTLENYEEHPELVLRDRKMQELQRPDSFLNCVTRGVGVKRQWAVQNLYDPQFTYSMARDAGFGWEDIEFGYRVFSRGAKIAFAEKAFSVHVTHPEAVHAAVKFMKSLRNYRRLHEKHPDLFALRKEWSQRTYGKILLYHRMHGITPHKDDQTFLDGHLGVDREFFLRVRGEFLIRRYGAYLKRPREMYRKFRRVLSIGTVRKGMKCAYYAGKGMIRDLMRRKPDVVIYTAIFGKRDILREPKKFRGVDYVCFTDDPTLTSNIWRIVLVEPSKEGPRRGAKIYKILPHRYFANYTYSLWVDGTHIPRVNPWRLVGAFLKRKDIALFAHHGRDCIYREAWACVVQQKDREELIAAQMQKYRSEQYPHKNGLATCTVILRRHNQEPIKKAMEDWWAEISNFSSRDQLSFNYVMWKNSLEYAVIPGHVYNNHYFAFFPHRGEEAAILKGSFFQLLPPRLERKVENFSMSGQDRPVVAVIMPVFNHWEYTRDALNSYFSSIDQRYRYILVVIDDASCDETQGFLEREVRKCQDMAYLRFKNNGGVTKAWNYGMHYALGRLKADYVVLVNNDILLPNQALGLMIDGLLQQSGPAIIGPLSNGPGMHAPTQHVQLYLPDYQPSHHLADIELVMQRIAQNPIKKVQEINGFFWAGSRDVFIDNAFLRVGSWPLYFFNPLNRHYGNEREFQRRLRKRGVPILLACNAFVFHYKDISLNRAKRGQLSPAAIYRAAQK